METLRDLQKRLGNIPLERIRFHPAPGTATEADVLARPDGVKRLCELVDGVLVEKPPDFYGSVLGAVLIGLLGRFLDRQRLGVLSGPGGPFRLVPGLVRMPDVAFTSWHYFPNRELPDEAIPDLAPDLAVEVLSKGNTEDEMERKLQDYFGAGVQLVWYIDPRARTTRVYTSPADVSVLLEDDVLDGSSVLPGFHLTLRELLDRAGRLRAG